MTELVPADLRCRVSYPIPGVCEMTDTTFKSSSSPQLESVLAGLCRHTGAGAGPEFAETSCKVTPQLRFMTQAPHWVSNIDQIHDFGLRSHPRHPPWTRSRGSKFEH